MSNPAAAAVPPFSPYQKTVVAILAFLQFAVILDFMLMSPLGAVIMPALDITTAQFGTVVSAYAFAAGVSGLLTAGFADRFDRKRLLLFFYSGFILGTLWCGLAQSFGSLLLARVVTGVFGGVIGSIVLAIATDLFAVQLRGRVMGMVQTAFAASQVLGIPFGIYLASRWNWHIPFIAMVVLGVVGGLLIAWKLQPVTGHLEHPQEHSAVSHLLRTVTEPRYLVAFLTVMFLATGGFMLMPFSSAFTVSNLGIGVEHLPTIYLATGIATIFAGPLIGKAADAVGHLRLFFTGSALTVVMVLVYTHLGPTTIAVVIAVSIVMFVGIFSRMVPFQAMMSQVPAQTQRGSFNAINSSIQSFSGGLASLVAGHIVTRAADGRIQHYEIAGYVVVASAFITCFMMVKIQRGLRARDAAAAPAGAAS